MQRRPVVKVLAFLLLAALAAALPLSALPRPHRDAKEQIMALEAQWRQAQLNGDIPAMEKLLSDNFMGVTVSGQVVTKMQQLDRMRNRQLLLTRFEISDTKIKFLANGQVAIVNSLAQVEGTAEGHSVNGSFRYTRVYQRLPDGTWNIASFNATRVPGAGRLVIGDRPPGGGSGPPPQ